MLEGPAVLGISGTELVIILVFGFLIFGPDRLPAMGRTIGRALRQFKQAQDQMNKMVKTEIYDPINEAVKEPAKKEGPKKKVTGSTATKPETFAEKKARLAAEAQAKAAGTNTATEAAKAAVPEKPVGRSETFAEKKARLEAEKHAAEVAKAAADAPAQPAPDAPRVRTAANSKKKAGTSSRSAKLYELTPVTVTPGDAPAASDQSGKGDQADA